MKTKKLLFCISTLLLFSACAPNTSSIPQDDDLYKNIKYYNESGVIIEGLETLKIEENTFRYVKSEVTSYSKEAASKKNISGSYTISTEADYSGTVTMEKSDAGADVYVLSYSSYTYKYIVTGEGAEGCKNQAKPTLSAVFGAQEAIDLLNDKTITSYYGGKYKALLNEEDKTFAISIAFEL